jgi:gas vesicle protein
MNTEARTNGATTGQCTQSRTVPYGLVTGLIAGGVVGVAIGMIVAPRQLVDMRQRATRKMGDAASAGYDRMSAAANEAACEVSSRAKAIRDDISDAVVHGVHEVEQVAASVGAGR